MATLIPDTRAEIEAMIVEANRAAKREFPVVGSLLRPTPWDGRHRRIDDLLWDWEDAPDGRAAAPHA